MAAKVIVIVEDEDPSAVANGFAIEVSGGKSADSASDDDQIVRLTRVFGFSGRVPERAVAESVGGVERAGMAAAHAGEGWRIVSGRILAFGGARREMPRHHRGPGGYSY